MNEALWTAKNIAEFFQVGMTTAREKIIASPGFPRPVKVANTQSRWIPDEVTGWAKRQRG